MAILADPRVNYNKGGALLAFILENVPDKERVFFESAVGPEMEYAAAHGYVRHSLEIHPGRLGLDPEERVRLLEVYEPAVVVELLGPPKLPAANSSS